MARRSSDPSQGAFSLDAPVEHKEEIVKTETKIEEPVSKVEAKPQIPMPDYRLLELLERIRDGTEKLWKAWYAIRETPEGEVKDARIRKWDEARDKLGVFCMKVRVEHANVCPFEAEKPKYTCLDCARRPFTITGCPCWDIDILKKGGVDENASIAQSMA